MYKISEDTKKYCFPCDESSCKEGIPLSLNFDFVTGALTSVPPGDDTLWRTMPFHLCCLSFDRPGIAEKTSLEIQQETLSEYTVSSDAVIFIPAGTPHRLHDLSGLPNRSLWSHFRISAFGALDLMDFYQVPPILPNREKIRDLLLKLTGLPPKLTLFESVQQQMLGFELAEELIRHGSSRKLPLSWHENVLRMMPVIQAMKQHPERHVEVGILARTVSLSVSRFLALFKRASGMSPGEFRENERFRKACALLMEREITVKEIAALLGYADQYHFSKRFKESSGVSPKTYRATVLRGCGENK